MRWRLRLWVTGQVPERIPRAREAMEGWERPRPAQRRLEGAASMSEGPDRLRLRNPLRTWPGALLLLGLLPGCWGYHTLGDTPGRIRSAAVIPFQNRTLYTGLEFELQDALVKELQAKSGIGIVGEAQADALLKGRVLDFGRAVIKQDEGGRDIEFQITVTAGFSLQERHTGKVLVERESISVSGTYLLTRGESETTARARALSDLAERIVSVILYGW